MITVNSISGGKSSAYVESHYPADISIFALVRMEYEGAKFKDDFLRQKVEDRIQAPFIATPEMDEIIQTIFDLEQYTGREITWVTGPTFEELIKMKGNYLPNKVTRYCTTNLKIRPIAEYLYHKAVLPVETRIGFRAGEESRLLKKMDKCNAEGYEEVDIVIGEHKSGRHKGNQKWLKGISLQKPTAPLIDDRVYREDVNRWADESGITFAEMNNCVGCWWRNEPLLNVMSQKQPETFEAFNQWEKNSEGTFRTDVTYEEIKNANFTIPLDFEDFSGCDSGSCGL